MSSAATYTYQPIILIGAGRSGTKIIRDVIGSHPEIAAVPFDVNYIWTIGQSKAQDDALSPETLTNRNRKLIIKEFKKHAGDKTYLLEKTVSNSIRIPYVRKVYPDAKFIYLVRDGRDVVESVARQWGEVRGLSYILAKLKTFPIRHSLQYLLDYGVNWLKHGMGGKGKETYIWGVRYPGYLKDLETKTTLEVCATQWRYCVETSEEQIAELHPDNVLHLRYEDVVSNPEVELEKVAQFIGVNSDFDHNRLNPSNIGKYKTKWNQEQLTSVLDIILPTLKKIQYT